MGANRATKDGDAMNPDLIEKLSQCDDLPTIPAVALEVLRLCKSPDASFEQVEEVVRNDPVLTGRLISLANSAMFRSAARAATVRQALVRMGTRAVRLVALSCTVSAREPARSATSFNVRRFWERSLVTAVAATAIEQHSSFQYAADAFTAGLLQDIGMLALNNAMGEDYEPVAELWAAGSMDICDVEQQHLGWNHTEVAGYLLGLWNVPDAVTQPIVAHHCPTQKLATRESQRLARVLHAADALAQMVCLGAKGGTAKTAIDVCRTTLGWPPRQVLDTVREIKPMIQDAQRMLAVDIDADRLTNTARTELSRQMAALNASDREAPASPEPRSLAPCRP